MRSLLLTIPMLLLSVSGWADTRSDLEAGKVLVISVPQGGVWPGRAMAIVNAPAARVYQILADFSEYQQFVPRVTGSKKLANGRYEILARFPWPVNDTRVQVNVKAGSRKGMHVVTWKMAQGSLKKYEGTAWIQTYGKGRCLLTYQMLAVPRGPFPSAIMNHGLRKAAQGVVKAVRKRVAVQTAMR